ncbi:class C sortase [Bifidobacterium longum subsp. longum]|nr:class C sortase [Bifidobacterium longum]QSG89736.1 class C sortase [Bifidobacterium longum subsp. longum]MED7651550.1 class C sortase [Bifidobacterium longum]RGW05152.1 class C sortase [Bifidobacterium longum]RGW12787.1 class C sortase [Bifidobacterium longum]
MAEAVRDRRDRDRRARRLLARSRMYAAAALACLIVGGILICMPRIQQLIGDRTVDRQARGVSQSAAMFPSSSRQDAIRSAVAYNERLYRSGQPQIGEPVFDGKTKGNFEGDDEYRRQLSVNGLDAMGELLIPKISVDLPIMHGASQDVLEHAAGHLAGTSLPVGGRSTRAVITGHSNLRGATLFTRLGELDEGDPFYIKVMGNTLAYRVNDIRIVSPTDTKALKIRKGRDEVTLLTCTGQGNTLRLLVTGERNSMPDQAPLPGDAPSDTKQAIVISLIVMAGVLISGFAACRSRDVFGRHVGGHGNGRR